MQKLNTLSLDYCLGKIKEYSNNPEYKTKKDIIVDIDCSEQVMPFWKYQMLLDEGAAKIIYDNGMPTVRAIDDSYYVRVYKDDGTTVDVYNCESNNAETLANEVRSSTKDKVEIKSWPMKYLQFAEAMLK